MVFVLGVVEILFEDIYSYIESSFNYRYTLRSQCLLQSEWFLFYSFNARQKHNNK